MMEPYQRYEQELVSTLHRMIDDIKSGALVVYDHQDQITTVKQVGRDSSTSPRRHFHFELDGTYQKKGSRG